MKVILGTTLQVTWPNQQCCSTEGQWLVDWVNQQPIPPGTHTLVVPEAA